jgi:hypothetical protein
MVSTGEVDDPSGGRGLTRRLRAGLPAGALAGAAIGVPLAILASDWRIVLWLALGVAALVGVVLAAVEDGRVQRRVDAQRRRKEPPAP